MSAKRTTKKTATPEVKAKEPLPSPIRLGSLGEGWDIVRPTAEEEEGTSSRTRRFAGGEGQEMDMVKTLLADSDFEELDRIEARPTSGRRSTSGEGTGTMPLAVTIPAEAVVVVVARQESGAISFHRPSGTIPTRRAAAATNSGEVTVTFEIPLKDGDSGNGRRGALSKIVRLVLVKVADKLVGEFVEHASEWIVPRLAREVEKRLWKNRTQGWLRVTQDGLAAVEDKLPAGRPDFRASERGLLFIHGTFSTVQGGFKNLASTAFFKEAKKIYGSNFYGFDHFTFSKTPAENVKEMLDSLPPGDFEFDIITHSRGGLVARELLEGSGLDHPKRKQLKIGKVIMVASPSMGTPLASPELWEGKLSVFANVMELLPVPENPFTTGAAWLAEALKWFAGNVLGNCPGLVVMDPKGDFIDEIQNPSDAPADTLYHALVSNYQPPREWLPRLGDMAMDGFFGGANDLVVPTEGGWKTADTQDAWIHSKHVACFGPGGNLASATAIHHGSYFGQADSVAFMLSCLKGEPTGLTAIDTGAKLPTSIFRAKRGVLNFPEPRPEDEGKNNGKTPDTIEPTSKVARTGWSQEDELSLTVVSNFDHVNVEQEGADDSVPMLIARYGSARVAVPFYIKGTADSAGKRWQMIIDYHRRIVSYANGSQVKFPDKDGNGSETPDRAFLENFGDLLFRTLFPPEVRNLYNVARFLHSKRRLKITFTSMIPWVADIPWEFAYDRDANSFISCSDVRFVRNVLTPTPVNKISPKTGPLRILVVSAQPSGLGKLSIDEEKGAIIESFRPLIDAKMVEVDVLPGATAALLHERLRYQGDGDEFDVLHFIGHGEFHEKSKTGYLILQDESGRPKSLSAASFLNIVQGRNIRVVFLNACETGRGAKADYNRGVAMALVQDGIPAVVANQYSVIDRSAAQFSLHFYSCLAQGLTLGDAMREARISMHYCGVEEIDWGIPVLFATNPDARVCEPIARKDRQSKSSADFNILSHPAGGRRGDKFRQKRVAVWDADNSREYGEVLEGLLKELNQAQDRFVFVFERFNAPRSLWSVNPDTAVDDMHYLPAPRVVSRMRRILKALDSDFLFCVTALPLRDEDTTELYYFSDNDEPGREAHKQVSIFSTWNLQPQLKDLSFKQAITNHLAISLLEELSGVSSGGVSNDDSDHPIHTLGFFNENRVVAHIAGRMKITKDTDRKFQVEISNGIFDAKDYQALKALFDLYQ